MGLARDPGTLAVNDRGHIAEFPDIMHIIYAYINIYTHVQIAYCILHITYYI